MATKATKATAARARARREKARRPALDIGDASMLELINAICNQVPSPVGPDEQRVWNWLLMYDNGWSWKGGDDLAGFERHVEGETGYQLAEDGTWRRLMEPAAVEGRRHVRRQVDEALAKLEHEVMR